jgi:hypothetical protein
MVVVEEVKEVKGGVVVVVVEEEEAVEVTLKGRHLSSATSAGSENERVIFDPMVVGNRGDWMTWNVIRGLGTAVRSGYGIVYWLYVRDVILTSLAYLSRLACTSYFVNT